MFPSSFESKFLKPFSNATSLNSMFGCFFYMMIFVHARMSALESLSLGSNYALCMPLKTILAMLLIAWSLKVKLDWGIGVVLCLTGTDPPKNSVVLLVDWSSSYACFWSITSLKSFTVGSFSNATCSSICVAFRLGIRDVFVQLI